MRIPILGMEISKGSAIDDLKKRFEDVQKKVVSLEQTEFSNRPGLDFLNRFGDNYIKIPYYPLPMRTLFDLANYSDLMQNILLSLKGEIFRNGWLFEESFTKKCTNELCGKEYEHETEICDICGFVTKSPDPKQILEAEKRLGDKINLNGQDLLEVCGQIEDDLNVVDDAYILINKQYAFNLNMEISRSQIQEVLRADPNFMRIIANDQGVLGVDNANEPILVCPNHRHEPTKQEHCGKCHCKTYPAFYVAQYDYTNGAANSVYYLEGEVIHVSKYHPSLLYGLPPILAVWQKLVALMNMDWHIKEAFSENRPPKTLLLVRTRNADGLEKAWNKLKENYSRDPHSIYPLAIDSNDGQGSFAEVLKLMENLQEMQFIEAREEFRKTVGAVYGVMPLFSGDTGSSGGLNNEGLQITVTNRAVERGQNVYNNHVFPALTKAMGITDYKLKLKPVEEKDQMSEIQIQVAKAQLAKQMMDMGFTVERDEKGEFSFSGQPKSPQLQPQGFLSNNTQQNLPNVDQNFDGEPESVRRSANNSVNKNVNIALRQKQVMESEFAKALMKQLKEELSKIDYKKKVSQTEMLKRASDIASRLAEKFKSVNREEVRKIYQEAVEGVEKDLNRNILFDNVDKNALEVLYGSDTFTNTYKNLEENVSKKLNTVIRKSYEEGGVSISDLVDKMQDEVSATEGQLRNIARNETHNISTLARLNSYSKSDDGTFKYKWIGPNDYRTTEFCKSISDATEKGVPLEQLKSIIKDNADSNVYKSDRPFVPHLGCRHTFVRVV